ncbi:GNAT family N-acetyltransferase [Amycolatopsis sp. NPDC049868]|uniref:GNAT family N-acetyltransferase n=1 Tax=Amycolatopsis sp. NPDC049868 TaxID=3363934 RepID=UPI003790718D
MEITTWHLEQTSPDDLSAAKPPAVPVTVTRAELVSPELNRYLYTAVGGDWFWIDRLGWSWDQWIEWLDRPGVETWVAYAQGTPCGYFELDGTIDGEVELEYFGLMSSFVGKGLGGHLLAIALREAWALAERWPGKTPTRRVTVHTCTTDGPAALKNYQARGFRLFRTDVEQAGLPAETPGPWPGAGKNHGP